MRLVLSALLLASLFAPFVGAPTPVFAADCQFVLGFKVLHDLIPDVVGDCKTDEYHNPENGDGLQETTRGLLVWRKADNFTAFTDGYRTWVNGPYGIQVRLSAERFPWEADHTRRLATGTFVRDADRNGLGKLTVENGRDLDAVAVLTTLGGAPSAAVYVRGGDSFAVTGIRDGTYHLYFTLGEDWDRGSARFTRKARFLRFEDTLTFQTTSIPGGRRYTTFRATLHPVIGGNAATIPVDAASFPALK